MAFYYFDTSALVKYYVTEPGSTWVRQVIEELNSETGRPSHVILVAEITRVEVAAGLAVIERIGRIGRTARNREYGRFISHLALRYAIVPLSTDDFEKAAALTQQYPLKAYDAVQLAAALRSRGVIAAHPFTFVCGDTTLISAAKAEGLAGENPFDHVTPEDTSARLT